MSTNRSRRAGGRLESTRATHRRIVAAATTLLLSDGYHAMSVSALARAAGVSPQTVYNSIGGKADVLKLVHDILLAGEARDPDGRPARVPADVGARPTGSRSSLPTPACAGSSTERVGPLLGTVLAQGAGSRTPGWRRSWPRPRRSARTDQILALSTLEAVHGLPDGFSRDVFLDEVWCLTAPEVYDRLVRRCGWSHEAYVFWLAEVLVAAFERAPGGELPTRGRCRSVTAMLRVGLTGESVRASPRWRVGWGLGAAVVDADVVAREIMEPGTAGPRSRFASASATG